MHFTRALLTSAWLTILLAQPLQAFMDEDTRAKFQEGCRRGAYNWIATYLHAVAPEIANSTADKACASLTPQWEAAVNDPRFLDAVGPTFAGCQLGVAATIGSVTPDEASSTILTLATKHCLLINRKLEG